MVKSPAPRSAFVWITAMFFAFPRCDRASLRRFFCRDHSQARTPADAVTPVMKDPYRHQEFLDRIKRGEVDLLFLGDSLTDLWPQTGERSWLKFANYKPADFGVSADRTEHLLWRITNGELNGINPKVVVILIGTNNVGQLEDERPEWVAKGIKQIVTEVRGRLPQSKVLLLGIFPRDGKEARERTKIREVNDQIRNLDEGTSIRFLDIGDSFLDRDGNIPSGIMPDQLHLTDRGYEIWFEKMRPLLDEMMR
jgi:lysophospholipase L1-like esterase